VAAAWLAGLRVEALQLALLYCAPAIALAVLLLSGRYPGAQILERRIAHSRPPRRRARATRQRRRRPTRGVALCAVFVAAGLAGRPPPAV
jgi:hypothetical protein